MAFQNILRQPAATWTSQNPTLDANVLGVESNIINGTETDTGKAKLGNGFTAWASLGYFSPSGGGSGDVVGPASATDGNLAVFDGATGKLIKDGGAPAAGTVTSVSVTTANGVSGSVATATTTPAITVTLGAITPTTVNGNTITTGTGTLTIAASKTLTASNSITLAGTDSTTMTFPPASANIGYLESPINSQANDYTGLLADSGKTILITGASKTFTIPANASVAYPVGTCLSGIFTNATGGSVAITTDTMTLANSTSTGTRTVAQNGRWTAQKMTSTTWLISGVGIA